MGYRPGMETRNPFDLTGKIALVTGASRGIGEAVARAFARQGARVALVSRKREDLEQVADAIRADGGEALVLPCHTGKATQVAEVVETVESTWGGLDILVNNAATNPHFGPLLSAEEGHWDKTFEVNVKGYFHTAQAAVPAMRRRGGGKIVNIASVAGIAAWSGLGVYSVSKAAVLMLTRVLATELAADDIQVNAIAPGLIQTRFSEALWKDEKILARLLAQIPQRRLGQPEELVGIALYLAGPGSSFTTGQVFTVDGGQTLGSGR
jgi:NAD(P)-dependent dehydrogenase (short-subunit alcohol dehydrogenase family)